MEERLKKLEMDLYALKVNGPEYVIPTESKEIDKFLPAFLKVQNEMGSLVANKKGQRDSNYADVGALMEHLRPLLSKHGFSIKGEVLKVNGDRFVNIKVIHTSGQFTAAHLQIESSSIDLLKIGADFTNSAKFLLRTIFLLAPEDKPKSAYIPRDDSVISYHQAGEIMEAADNNEAIIDAIKKKYKADFLESIPAKEFNVIMNTLKA